MNQRSRNLADRWTSAGCTTRAPSTASFRVPALILAAVGIAFPWALNGCAPAPIYRSHPEAREAGLREAAARDPEIPDPGIPDPGIPSLGFRLYPPVRGFNPARITSGFGIRSSSARRHDGIDIKAAPGEEILAAASGSVSFSGWKRGYGDVVIVDHGNGVSTLYAHLVSAAVKAGESIGAGEIVGRAGKRGRATGTHLHFEVRRGGSPIDPVPYLWLDSGGE